MKLLVMVNVPGITGPGDIQGGASHVPSRLRLPLMSVAGVWLLKCGRRS